MLMRYSGLARLSCIITYLVNEDVNVIALYSQQRLVLEFGVTYLKFSASAEGINGPFCLVALSIQQVIPLRRRVCRQQAGGSRSGW